MQEALSYQHFSWTLLDINVYVYSAQSIHKILNDFNTLRKKIPCALALLIKGTNTAEKHKETTVCTS